MYQVSDSKICPHCNSPRIVKNGKTRTGKQQYICRACGKRCLDFYTYEAYRDTTNYWIVRLTKEGCGIRSIVRVLGICCGTVQNRILCLSSSSNKPGVLLNQTYEVDELCTYVSQKHNRIWIAYGYCRSNKTIVDFVIGSRSKVTLSPLINSLLHSFPAKIHTDKHQTYAALIPVNLLSTKCSGTNHIERMNLTIRTHLKRLFRKTICFSKSVTMLAACLQIYFWR